MAQNVKVKISERDYSFTAKTEEDEHFLRLAAAEVNKYVDLYLAKFPGKSMVDILSFAAINGWVSSMRHKQVLDSISEETQSLEGEMESYLSSIEKNSIEKK